MSGFFIISKQTGGCAGWRATKEEADSLCSSVNNVSLDVHIVEPEKSPEELEQFLRDLQYTSSVATELRLRLLRARLHGHV